MISASSCSPCADRCAVRQADGTIAIVGVSPGVPRIGSWPSEVDRWRGLVEAYAAKHQVPPVLIAAVMRSESGGKPDALSPAGAMGLMQIMPDTYRWATGTRKDEPVSRAEAMRPEVNIDVGAKLLAYQLKRRSGNLVEVAVSYNAGSPKCGFVERCGSDPWNLREDCNYVDHVLGSINVALEHGYGWSIPAPRPPAPSSIRGFVLLSAVVGIVLGAAGAVAVARH